MRKKNILKGVFLAAGVMMVSSCASSIGEHFNSSNGEYISALQVRGCLPQGATDSFSDEDVAVAHMRLEQANNEHSEKNIIYRDIFSGTASNVRKQKHSCPSASEKEREALLNRVKLIKERLWGG